MIPQQQYILNDFMYQLQFLVIKHQRFCYNQIDSFNTFLQSDLGIKQVITKYFEINNNIEIAETKVTSGGQQFSTRSINLQLKFSNVQVKQVKKDHGEIFYFEQNGNAEKKQLTMQETNIPNEARRNGKTLRVIIYADLEVIMRSFESLDCTGPAIETSTWPIKEQIIAQLPLMVGSSMCMLNQNTTKQQAIQLQEDPSDQGGYFIIKGNEYAVDSTESVKFNELQIGYIAKSKLVRSFIMSKPGDAFELSIQVVIWYCEVTGRIYINLEHERIKFVDIPFFFIFKIFGVHNEIEMMQMITEDAIQSNDEFSLQLQKYISRAASVSYPQFPNASDMKDNNQILESIVQVLNSDKIKKKKLDLARIDYDINSLREKFFYYFLPHMGTGQNFSTIKMRFFGYLLKKVLMTHRSGVYPNQNAYIEKRIHSTGQNISKMFRKNFNFSVIKKIKFKLIQEISQLRSVNFNPSKIIQTILKDSYDTKQLQKSITTGTSGDQPKQSQQQQKNKVQSQRIERKNILSTTCVLRYINNQKQSQDKQSKKIIQQRAIQQSYAGFICIVQSTETGEKAGKVKSLGSMAIITTMKSTSQVSSTIIGLIPDYLVPPDSVNSQEVQKLQFNKMFVNGFWLGYIQNQNLNTVAKILREYRRQNPSDWKHVTVYINDQQELHIYSDYGRLVMPMLIVYYDNNGNPYFKVTPEIMKKIMERDPEVTIDWMLEKQIIEYVSIEESHNCLAADTLDTFINKTDQYRKSRLLERTDAEVYNYLNIPDFTDEEVDISKYYKFTHVFLPQSMLGIVALTSPFCNYTQLIRSTYYTSQARQSCGWGTLNFPFRMDKLLLIQQYIAKPSVTTIMSDFFPLNGHQLIVSYQIYDGANQEDSVILNKGAIDRGLMSCIYYTSIDVVIQHNDSIWNLTHTQPPNVFGNYEKLVNGIVEIGQVVEKSDILVAKQSRTRNETLLNASVSYNSPEPATVEDIVRYYDESDNVGITIKLKCIRNLKQGDKLSTRSGCKAIISKILDPCDMPFSENGVIPDIIFNPHSIPTRMNIGQIYEAAASRLCVQNAENFDSTVFCNYDLDYIYQQMESSGVQNKGYLIMNNGKTGDQIIEKISVCPTVYQRIQKFAIQEQYVVHEGPKDPLTKQPIDGRQIDGGIRIGEMEKDVMIGHGATSLFSEKFYDHSDRCTLIFCRSCGYKAKYNPSIKTPIYKCDQCANETELVKVNSAWITNVFQHNINAMNIDMSVGFEQPCLELPLE